MDHGSHSKSYSNNNVYLVGNPNVGKSVLFAALTQKYAMVSNYPGTTVEITSGNIQNKLWSSEKQICLVDTPGVNSLVPLSEDERVTRDILLEHEKSTGQKPNVILVVDAKNLRRGLVLAIQLIFSKIPFMIAVNMMDEAASSGIKIDLNKLRKLFNVPVVPAIAIVKEGIGEILSQLHKPLKESSYALRIPSSMDLNLSMFTDFLHPLTSLSVIASDTSIQEFLKKEEIKKIESLLSDNSLNLHSLQMLWRENSDAIQSQVYSRDIPSKSGFLTSLGHWTINPYAGFVFLFGVIYATYKFVGTLGAGIGVDFLEKTIFGNYINPVFVKIFNAIPMPEIIREVFIGQFGIITMGLTYSVAIIFPIVVTFFIAFSFLEDSGYLPRMGALLNNFFKFMGLNGKAVLPMVLGLGCDTMATMTARVMNSRKERILVTLLLALGVPCSAQLGVIMAFASFIPFFYILIWGAIVVMVLFFVGYLSSKLIPGESSLFLLELPPIRIPKFSNLAMKTVIRTKWYLKEALPIFLFGTFLLFVFDKIHLIGFLNELLKPITTKALGLPEESARSFIMGFLRRDFGTAGFFMMYQKGMLNPRQVLVSLVVITLFIPCIANFLMIIKEQGIKIAMAMFVFIVPFAFLVGTILNYSLALFGL